MGRQHQEMDRPGVRQVPEGSGKQGKMEKTGCKIIFGAPTTLAVKGLIMMFYCVCVCVVFFLHASKSLSNYTILVYPSLVHIRQS